MIDNYFTLICTKEPRPPVYVFFDSTKPSKVAKAYHKASALIPHGWRLSVYSAVSEYPIVPVIGDGL